MRRESGLALASVCVENLQTERAEVVVGSPETSPEAGAADRGAQVHTDQQGVTGTPGRKSLCAWSPVQGGVSEGVEGLLVGGGALRATQGREGIRSRPWVGWWPPDIHGTRGRTGRRRGK